MDAKHLKGGELYSGAAINTVLEIFYPALAEKKSIHWKKRLGKDDAKLGGEGATRYTSRLLITRVGLERGVADVNQR